MCKETIDEWVRQPGEAASAIIILMDDNGHSVNTVYGSPVNVASSLSGVAYHNKRFLVSARAAVNAAESMSLTNNEGFDKFVKSMLGKMSSDFKAKRENGDTSGRLTPEEINEVLNQKP